MAQATTPKTLSQMLDNIRVGDSHPFGGDSRDQMIDLLRRAYGLTLVIEAGLRDAHEISDKQGESATTGLRDSFKADAMEGISLLVALVSALAVEG